MLKFLLSLFILSAATSVFADTTPDEVMAGSHINQWTQGGLRVTDKPFDLGIGGAGFFTLQLPDAGMGFVRYGEMSLDANGYLVHSPTQGLVLGFCDGVLEPMQFSRFARDTDGSQVKSFRVELDGSVKALYENGYGRETCKVALALFQNPLRLKRTSRHLLRPTPESGEAFIGLPHLEGRGSVYGSSLEELDEQMYRLNTVDSGTDRVAVEMEKARVALEQWAKQKTLFYVYDLNATREELAAIEASAARCDKEIQKIVKLAEDGPGKVSETDFSSGIAGALRQHEAEILEVLGPQRLAAAKKFREEFNKSAWDKFGTDLRFTGF